MTDIEAWIVSMLVPANFMALIGITFMVLWLWSEKLSFNPKTPANGVLQKLSPVFLAIGKKIAPPMIVQVMEAFEVTQTQTATATATQTTKVESSSEVTPAPLEEVTKEAP
jgi:hypothetical protein